MQNLIFIGVLSACLCGTFAQVIPSYLCDGVPADKYVRDVRDCKAYFHCNGTQAPTSGKCLDPDNINELFFNQEIQGCTILEWTNCYKCPSSTGYSNEVVANSCKRFIRCIKGVASEQICPDGTRFSPTQRKCMEESEVVCDEPYQETCPLNLERGDFYAYVDSADCSKGFVCIGDPDPIVINCEALHFNDQTLTCDPPSICENAECISESTPITPNGPPIED